VNVNIDWKVTHEVSFTIHINALDFISHTPYAIWLDSHRHWIGASLYNGNNPLIAEASA
jgi:hypothetical protein